MIRHLVRFVSIALALQSLSAFATGPSVDFTKVDSTAEFKKIAGTYQLVGKPSEFVQAMCPKSIKVGKKTGQISLVGFKNTNVTEFRDYTSIDGSFAFRVIDATTVAFISNFSMSGEVWVTNLRYSANGNGRFKLNDITLSDMSTCHGLTYAK